jgi:hypothetical protein
MPDENTTVRPGCVIPRLIEGPAGAPDQKFRRKANRSGFGSESVHAANGARAWLKVAGR